MKNDTPAEGTPQPWDFRLALKVAGAALGASLLMNLMSRAFSTTLRNNETLIFAAVLSLMLAGVYTWLSARQPDAAKFVPPAIVAVLALFVPGDLSEARGNVESMERFWNTLPAYGAILGGSMMVAWHTWFPGLRKWARPPAAPVAKKKVPSGGVKKKKTISIPSQPPQPSQPPRPSQVSQQRPSQVSQQRPSQISQPPRASQVSQQRPPEPSQQRPSQVSIPLPKLRTNPPEHEVDLGEETTAPNPMDAPKLQRSITTELPKLRKPKG